MPKPVECISKIQAAHHETVFRRQNNNLYKSQPPRSGSAVFVVVNVLFGCRRNDGNRYTGDCMLDVDIPPPGSSQAPHFGWEVKLNGGGLVGLLGAGRPKPGQLLETYGYQGGFFSKNDFQYEESVEGVATFRRYK